MPDWFTPHEQPVNILGLNRPEGQEKRQPLLLVMPLEVVLADTGMKEMTPQNSLHPYGKGWIVTTNA